MKTPEAWIGRGSPHRCVVCRRLPTSEGHDACLGTLPGPVWNACCGHDDPSDAYVQFRPRSMLLYKIGLCKPRRIAGDRALAWIAEHTSTPSYSRDMFTPGQIRQAAHPASSRPLLKFAEGHLSWWFDGDHFFRNRSEAEEQGPAIAPGSAEASHILGAICRRLFKINRWQGESGPHGCVSVGAHSLLVATIAGCLADVRGDASDRRICYRAGAAHDLGEALGMGDPAAQWVRAYPGIREQAERHQRAVERLLSFGAPIGVRALVKDADHLAAAIERRVIFGDDSREMESPGMDELALEALNLADFSTLHPSFVLGPSEAGQWLGVDLLAAISPPT